MAAHRQIDGVYQWELSIPPASTAALLSAMCVNLDDPNSHYVGHLLLGPKTWEIQFRGNEFKLRPLGVSPYHLIYGAVSGRIIDAKGGSRLEIRLGTVARYTFLFSLLAIPASIGFATMLFQFLSGYALWIRVMASAAAIAWFAFAGLWLISREPLGSYLNFIDDLFADYIVSGEDEESPSPPVTKTACAK